MKKTVKFDDRRKKNKVIYVPKNNNVPIVDK